HLADQADPSHLLSRQLKVETSDVIRIQFGFDSSEGVAFFDLKNSALHLSQNPFDPYIGNIQNKISQAFRAALDRKDFDDARKSLETAKKYKLAVPVDKWETDIKTATEKFKRNRQLKHLSTVVLAKFTAVTVVSWFVFAFVAQVGLGTFLAFSSFAWIRYRNLKNLSPDDYWKKQTASFFTLLVSLLVLGAVLTGVTVYTGKEAVQTQLRQGESLIEAQQ
nr:hypothetical protein [Pseudobdellovibrionaceae bacterium]